MTKNTVHQVIKRAISDAGFRRRLREDPKSALQGYDLSADERAAVTTADPTKLTGMGVDQRMSKAFAVGAVSEASRGSAGDLSAGTPAAFDGAGGNSLSAGFGDPLLTEGASDTDALIGAPSHLQIVEGALDTVGATKDVISAGSQSPDMIDQLHSASGEVISAGFQSPDTIERIQAAASAGTAPTHLQQVEGALDGGAATQDVTSAGWQSPDMIDQLHSASGEVISAGFQSPDTGELITSAATAGTAPTATAGTAPTHLQQVEGALDGGAATQDVTSAGWQSPDMIDQLSASTGYPAHFGLAGPSDVGASAYPAHDGLAGPSQVDGTLTHLQQVEGDLDTGASATAFEDADPAGSVTRMNEIDGNIDTTSYASADETPSVEGHQVVIDDGTGQDS